MNGYDYESEKTLSLWTEEPALKVTLYNHQNGQKYSFHLKHTYTIGRNSRHCDLQIPEDGYVSGIHARFLTDGNWVYLEDLQSRNGTRINGSLISGKSRVRKGDRIRVGRTEFQVDIR